MVSSRVYEREHDKQEAIELEMERRGIFLEDNVVTVDGEESTFATSKQAEIFYNSFVLKLMQ